MADRKISDLTALTTPASGDYVPIVDISEGAAASKNKRVTIQSLFQGIPVNVGIGTASPGAKLHVETIPQLANQSGSVLFGPNTDYGLEIRNVIDGVGFPRVELRAPVAGAGPMLFFAGGATERLRIDSIGRVGIGTSSPQAALHVNGTELRVETSATSEGFVRFVNASGSMSFGMSGAVGNAVLLFDRTNNQSAYIYTGGASGSHAWSTNNIERMRIDSTGRVGIGTSSPTTLLDVNADTVRVRTARTPASASATGVTGEICWDANYIYVAVGTNTWKRAALSTW